jgi:rare lipoprotein A (peptidoglycan hydrolase)
MTMRTPFKKKLLLALVAAPACAGVLAVGALADTGGISSPAPSAPPRVAVHKTGIATWFGPGFYGQRTACGQTLTPAVVGVANRTLPCGTLVTVSYRGHRLTVPVIDRGPYGPNGADWDLTTQAARTLGIEDTVRISARVIGSVPNTPTLGLRPGTPAAGPPAAAATGGAIAG